MGLIRKLQQIVGRRNAAPTNAVAASVRPSESIAIFEQRIAGLNHAEIPLKALILSMLSFYDDVPASGVADEHGDMLLFQYGVFDWGEGPYFEIDLTRQFIELHRGDEDDVVSQLHVTRIFTPTDDLLRIGSGEKWCKRRSELPIFREWLMAQPALLAAENLQSVKAVIQWELV